MGTELTSMDSFRNVVGFGRWDAEYYRTKYQRALRFLADGGQSLADVAELRKHAFVPIGGMTFDYIEIGDVNTDGSISSRTVPGEEAPSRARWIVQANDLVISTVRRLRRLSAIVSREQEGFVCSSGFAVLKASGIFPEVLPVYLKNPLIAEILNLYATASMYPAVSTQDLMKLPFYRPRATEEIVERVQRARISKRQSLEIQADAVRAGKRPSSGEAPDVSSKGNH